MLPIKLKGNSLGERHKQLNTEVNEALKKPPSLDVFEQTETSDADRLFKIELAVKCKNVEYIVENLKSDDMLYVSRAMKAAWLFNEDQYAHIINPDHLYTSLFPQMYSKAIRKVKVAIHTYVRSEERCELFYNYHCNELDDTEGALPFLAYCSKDFIQNAIEGLQILKIDFYIARHYSKFNRTAATLYALKNMFKRICERFIDLAEIILMKVPASTAEHLLTVLDFIAISQVDMYLNLLEKYGRPHSPFPRLSSSLCKKIAKDKPERIFERPDVYLDRIWHGVIGKVWTVEQVHSFIETLKVKSESDEKAKKMFNYHSLRDLLKSQEEQTILYEKFFAEKVAEEVIDKGRDQYIFKTKFNGETLICSHSLYKWYKRFPFNNCYADMRPLIKASKSPEDRNTIVLTFLSLAKDPSDVQKLIQYYFKFHMNEQLMYKTRFLDALVRSKSVHNFNEETWKLTNELFRSIEIYSETGANYPNYIEAIVYYNILHDIEVPIDILTKYYSFQYLNSRTDEQIDKLTQEESIRVFDYLARQLDFKCQSARSETEGDRNDYSYWVTKYIQFLTCWKKCIVDYPTLIKGLTDVVHLKPEIFYYGTYWYYVAIVCHHIINNTTIPEMVMTKYFETSGYSNTVPEMSKDNKLKVFNYLVKDFEQRSTDMVMKENMKDVIDLTKKFIQFLRNCKKPLHEYPYLISLMKQIVLAEPNSLEYPNKWEKPTRKLLFDVSLMMSQDEGLILNVLKHDVNLIHMYFDRLITLMKGKSTYDIFLRKLVTYFPSDLAVDFQNFYKVLIKECEKDSTNVEYMGSNLPLIFKKQDYIDVIKEYLPSNPKINWNEEDAWILTIRKSLGANIFRVRPYIDMEIVYEFAKGDYLQSSLKSLLSVCMALPKQIFSEIVLPRLLNSPVSVQKHGVRLAFRKLALDSVSEVLKKMWAESKNVSIRNTVFETTFTLLTEQVKYNKIDALWELLENFTTNLREDEERTILTYFHSHIKSLPKTVRGKSCRICYRQMEKIKDKIDWNSTRNSLMIHMFECFTDMDIDFVAIILLETFEELCKSSDFDGTSLAFRNLLMQYLTYDEEQSKRYEKVAKPIFSAIIDKWDKKSGNIETVLDQMLNSFIELTGKHLEDQERVKKIPVFQYFFEQFQNTCRVEKNFAYYLKMKLLVIFHEAVVESNSEKGIQFYKECAIRFSRKCGQILDDLVKLHFPSIWVSFSAVVFGFSREVLSNAISYIRGIFLLSFIDNLLSNTAPANNYLLGLYFYMRLDINVEAFDKESDGFHEKVTSKIKSIENKEIQFHLDSRLL